MDPYCAIGMLMASWLTSVFSLSLFLGRSCRAAGGIQGGGLPSLPVLFWNAVSSFSCVCVCVGPFPSLSPSSPVLGPFGIVHNRPQLVNQVNATIGHVMSFFGCLWSALPRG